MSLESTNMTDTASASAEIHERQAAARARVIGASDKALAEAFANDGEYGGSREAVTAAMLELAQVWREEAEYFAAAKRRGWKSTSEQYLQAAAHLAGFAQGLTSVVSTGIMVITVRGCPWCARTMTADATACEDCATGLESGHWMTADGTRYPSQEKLDDVSHAVYPMFGCTRHQRCAELPDPFPRPMTVGEAEDAVIGGVHLTDEAIAQIQSCDHPDAQRSTLKSGLIMCTLCNETVGQVEGSLGDLVPGSKRGPVVTGDATLDYLSGAVDTYEPVGHNSPVGTQVTVGGIGFTKIGESPFGDQSEAAAVVSELITATAPTPAADNPFTSPAAPGSNRAPVARLTWAQLGPLTAATYPVPRPHLSHSYVESLSRCGLSALLSDASKANLLGPRRPSWSLIGGNAFHSAIETIERAAISIGGGDPGPQHDNPYWTQFWEAALTYQVDELTAPLAGTPYANPSTWHTANKGLEGFDWWRVQGLDMILRYLKLHDTAWRACHTLLQVPADPAAEARTPGQVPRVPVLELPFTVTAGSTALTTTGFIDAAWLSTSTDYPTATLEVVDHKSGKSLPSEHFQLTEYADVLRRYLPTNFGLPVVGRFYRARLGAYTPPIPLPQRPGQDEIDYRYQAAERAMKHAAFTPHPDNMCSSCGSVDFCPAQALRDGASA